MAPSRGASKSARPNGNPKTQKGSHPARDDAKHDESQNGISIALQQRLLNVFRDSFSDAASADYERTLQQVKSHLYNRDFSQAFGKSEYLAVYALRWSPSRALCYAGIFDEALQSVQRDTGQPRVTIACLGGGAGAEVVGLAGALAMRAQTSTDGAGEPSMQLDVRAIDIADWTDTIAVLQAAVTNPLKISAYASAAAKAANHPLVVGSDFAASFRQADLLKLEPQQSEELVGSVQLITLMFTLNELYSASLPATQAFLQTIGSITQVGTLLLVVDSPGSYSNVTLNGNEKQYPMHWLLDHALINQPSSKDSAGDGSKWQKLRTEESAWFRLSDQLKYPIQLENMRYQLHLYRRI